jgi:hypothetical protein
MQESIRSWQPPTFVRRALGPVLGHSYVAQVGHRAVSDEHPLYLEPPIEFCQSNRNCGQRKHTISNEAPPIGA